MNHLSSDTSLHYIGNLEDPHQFIKDYNQIVSALSHIENEQKKTNPEFDLNKYWVPVYSNKEYSFKIIPHGDGATQQVETVFNTLNVKRVS